MKILAFGASSSANSINQKLAIYAASLFEGAEVDILNLRDFEMPLFCVDRESMIGKPEKAVEFSNRIANADLLLISLAEHNGNYTAVFKNVYDWISRGEKAFQNKPVFLLASSTGPRGGKTILEIAKARMPFDGADVKAVYSFPSFKQNFDVETNQIVNQELKEELLNIISEIKL